MAIRLLTSAEDFAAYDTSVRSHPQSNLWQSWERVHYIEARGKKAAIYVADNGKEWGASALVSIDDTKAGICTWEIPRGPLWTDEKAAQDLVTFIIAEAKKSGVMAVYLSPILPLSLQEKGWKPSARHIHAEATRILDISQSEEHILAQMHPKGRYNIKVAQKNGVMIREADDVRPFAKLAKETAGRDGFVAVSEKHYDTFLHDLPGSFLLLAYATDTEEPIAGLIGVTYGTTGIYYYGASDYAHRALMAPYLLQWEAMKRCKTAGCQYYDLLGIAPANDSAIPPTSAPAGATAGRHPWAGISDFKAKFGGVVVTYPTEQEIVLRPMVQGLLKMKRRLLG